MVQKLLLTFCIFLYAVGVPYLELNDTHVFNSDRTPHVRIREVWQLVANSCIGLFCLWFIWSKNRVTLSTILSMLVTGGFLFAFVIQDLYGGSMKYLGGSSHIAPGLPDGVYPDN